MVVVVLIHVLNVLLWFASTGAIFVVFQECLFLEFCAVVFVVGTLLELAVQEL